MLENISNDPEHLKALRSLGLVSYIAVPLLGPQFQTNPGAIILGRTSDSGLHYTQADLSLAEDLASRCAAAIEHAELYAEAQKAVVMRQDTLAIVSHDLRNPLNAILLGAELMERTLEKPNHLGPVNSALRRSLRHIVKSAKRGTTLIEDLLEFAKIESGTFTVEKKWAAVPEILDEAVYELQLLASEKGVALRINLPPSLTPLFCDKAKIYRVFANIIGNAVKFTPPGGKVELTAKELEGEVWFTIEDNGIGRKGGNARRAWVSAFRSRAGLSKPMVDESGQRAESEVAADFISRCLGPQRLNRHGYSRCLDCRNIHGAGSAYSAATHWPSWQIRRTTVVISLLP